MRFTGLLLSALATALLATPALACTPQPIASTHTAPDLQPGTVLPNDFPAKSHTILQVQVNRVGYPDALVVRQSSGSPVLDKAAATYVGQQWQWAPGCAANTNVSVEWNIPAEPAPAH